MSVVQSQISRKIRIQGIFSRLYDLLAGTDREILHSAGLVIHDRTSVLIDLIGESGLAVIFLGVKHKTFPFAIHDEFFLE